MRRYLLDTNALGDAIHYRRGVDLRVQAARRAGHVVGTTPPVIGELFFGLYLSRSPRREANLREARAALRKLTVWPYTAVAADEFGRLRAVLVQVGRPMQLADVQIAAVALTLGRCAVVTSDSDLSAVPGPAVEDWADPPTDG